MRQEIHPILMKGIFMKTLRLVPVLPKSKKKRGEVPTQNCSKLMLDGQVAPYWVVISQKTSEKKEEPPS